MTAAIIVITVLLAIVLLLWLPLIIRLDTRVPEMRIQWKGIATCTLTFQEYTGSVYLKTWLFRHRWTLGTHAWHGPRPGIQKPRQIRRRRSDMSVRKIIRLVRSFRIVRFDLALDTSDVALNGLLYPLNFFPYPAGKHVHINFLGENHLRLHIRNTAWRMLRAWFGS